MLTSRSFSNRDTLARIYVELKTCVCAQSRAHMSPSPARLVPADAYCSRLSVEDQFFTKPHLEPALTGGAGRSTPASARTARGLLHTQRRETHFQRRHSKPCRWEDPGAGEEPTKYVLGFLKYVTFPNTLFLENLVLKIQLHIENNMTFFV